MNIDTERLQALIDLVADEHIDELRLVESGIEFHIVRQGNDSTPARAAPVEASALPAAPADATTRATHTAKAPMAGTVYRAAGAGAKPLVEVGSRVEAGTPVCIVEAMKIMNEVAADRAGTVLRVLVEDGQTVDAGQPLIELEG